MAKKAEKTSKTVASKAAKILNDPESTADEKSVAASALTQASDRNTSKKMQQLLVGVNFRADGETDETRIEAGLIEAGTLPPSFENLLREKKQLVEV